MADYGSSGIWAVEPVGRFRHAMIECASLGCPADLVARFAAWIASYDERLGDRFDHETFNRTGRSLAEELKTHLGADTSVEHVPELAEGGVGPAVHIG
jgi:hypothetical protein